MSYYVINNDAQINRFKKYMAINMSTLMREQVGGGVILKESPEDLVDSSVFKRFDFETQNLKVRVDDKVLYVYSRGMSYMVSNIDVKYIYQNDRTIHVGVEGSENEVRIDMQMDKISYFVGMKAVTYEDNVFERTLPKRLRSALGICCA